MIMLADKHDLQSDIKKAQGLLGLLGRAYQRIPATSCKRHAHCCALMPEMSYVEFVFMVVALGRLTQDVQTEVIGKIVEHFFSNAVQIGQCPFLHQNACRIYKARPFTCRAYGLWSKAHYESLVAANRKAKEPVRAAWQDLGIRLPDDVVGYQPLYCDQVTTPSGGPVADTDLDLIRLEILRLDGDLRESAQRFQEVFFSDPSFLLTSALIGYRASLVEKITVAKEYMFKKRSARLTQLMDKTSVKLIRSADSAGSVIDRVLAP
jgi:Fe-S-cluster containining protein